MEARYQATDFFSVLLDKVRFPSAHSYIIYSDSIPNPTKKATSDPDAHLNKEKPNLH